jgi:hypothetical protein
VIVKCRADFGNVLYRGLLPEEIVKCRPDFVNALDLGLYTRR